MSQSCSHFHWQSRSHSHFQTSKSPLLSASLGKETLNPSNHSLRIPGFFIILRRQPVPPRSLTTKDKTRELIAAASRPSFGSLCQTLFEIRTGRKLSWWTTWEARKDCFEDETDPQARAVKTAPATERPATETADREGITSVLHPSVVH